MLKSLVKIIESKIDKNNEHSGQLKSVSLSMAIKVMALAAGYMMNWVFAFYLGPSGVGSFFIVFSVFNVVAMLGRLGFDRTLLRFSAAYCSKGEWGKIIWLQQYASITVGLLCILIGFVFFMFAEGIATNFFHNKNLTPLIQIFSFSIAPFAIAQNTGESIKGIGKIQLSQFLTDVIVFAFSIGVFVCWPSKSESSAAFSYSISVILAFVCTQYVWKKSISLKNDVSEKIDKKIIYNSAFPVFVASIFQQLIIWSPTFMLGLWSSSKDVGLFEIARRNAALIAIFQTVFNSITAPKISAFFANNEMKKIQSLCAHNTKIVILLALPVFICFTLFSSFFIGLFGHEFKDGATLLTIISIGQIFNVLMGPVGIALMMCGFEKIMRNILFCCGILIVLLGWLLIPHYGALGAAISLALILVIQNFAAAFSLWQKTGIITFPFLQKFSSI